VQNADSLSFSLYSTVSQSWLNYCGESLRRMLCLEFLDDFERDMILFLASLYVMRSSQEIASWNSTGKKYRMWFRECLAICRCYKQFQSSGAHDVNLSTMLICRVIIIIDIILMHLFFFFSFIMQSYKFNMTIHTLILYKIISINIIFCIFSKLQRKYKWMKK